MDSLLFEKTLEQARLKIYRANRHIGEAQHWFEVYANSEFCKIVEERDPQTGEKLFRVVSAPIPQDVVLAIGDAFHCMTAAMDYIMSGLMLAKTGNATRVTFPSDEGRDGLRKSFMSPRPGKKSPPNRRIMEAFPLIALELLSVVKPYKGGNFCLWEIRKADNIDKHNLIIPSVTVTEIRNMRFVDYMHNEGGSFVTVRVEAGGILKLMRYRADSQMEIADQGQATCEITFPDGLEVFAGEPVFPTLLKCIKLSAEGLAKIVAVSRKYL